MRLRPLLAFVVASVALAGCRGSTNDGSWVMPPAVDIERDREPLLQPAAFHWPVNRAKPDDPVERVVAPLRQAAMAPSGQPGQAPAGTAGTEKDALLRTTGNAILATADADVVATLASDELAVVRELGIWGMALRGDAAGLVRHACDRELVPLCTGDACTKVTLGEIAQSLIVEPTLLGLPTPLIAPVAPLVPSEAGDVLSMRLVAADGCVHANSLTAPALPSTWSALRARFSDIPAWKLAKAIARIDPKLATPILLAVLADATVSADARLAAASGLTLTSSNDAEAALLTYANGLDSRRPRLGNELAELVQQRRATEVMMAPIAGAGLSNDVLQKHSANAQRALDAPHAFLLPWVLDERVYGARQDAVLKAKKDALAQIVVDLPAHEECWDVYRDTPFVLERELAKRPAWLTPDELRLRLDRIRAEIVVLDRDERCR